MHDKKFYFLCSLPRAGNTLLGSILNQNKKISVTAKSILPIMLNSIFRILEEEEYKNFPDIKSFNNVYKNIFNLYYKDWKSEIIIDRAHWGTRENNFYLKHFLKKTKYIILYRPILECLASFLKVKNTPFKEEVIEFYLSENQIFDVNIKSIKNVLKGKDEYIIIYYKDLIKNTNKELKKIYNFLEIPFYNHKLTNFEQFKVNNVSYNDYFLDGFFHTIRTENIKKSEYKIEDFLPKNIIKKYSNLDIL